MATPRTRRLDLANNLSRLVSKHFFSDLLGVHPADGKEYHQLYFMCDDVEKTIAELARKGVKCGEVRNMGWGLATSFAIPGGGTIGMYEPRHASTIARKTIAKKTNAKKASTKKNVTRRAKG